MIDAHHHIWRQADLPWLLGPEQPRIFGAYDSIKRDYLIDEFIADTKGTGIKQSIYVHAIIQNFNRKSHFRCPPLFTFQGTVLKADRPALLFD